MQKTSNALNLCRGLLLLLTFIISLVPLTGSAHGSGATWTKGHRKVLIIPIRFTDRPGPSDNVSPNGLSGWGNITNGSTLAKINSFFAKQSYNQYSLEFTIIPEIDMGVPTSFYTNKCPGTSYSKWTEWDYPGSLADDACEKARQAGISNGTPALYDNNNYDLEIIAGGYNTYMAGSACLGGRSVLAFNFNVLPHELCHALGLQHANGTSRSTFASPTKQGTYFYNGYGDVYCVMGYKENTSTASPADDRDANAFFKYELGWLSDSNIITTTTSGTYRIHAFDMGSIDADKYYALRLARDSSYTYWLDFRQAITNFPDAKWSQHGLEVHYGGESPRATSGTTMLFDMTPGSRGPTGSVHATMHYAPLLIGRTYSDPEAHLHFTPIKKGNTTPESMDVEIQVGPFPGNQPPTLSISPTNVTLAAGVTQLFSAVASDPDGDPLSYFWEFDDNLVSAGTDFGGIQTDARLATQGHHAWNQKSVNFIRCTVSDMKGHARTVSASATITNGSPAPITISGRILDESGAPLADAIVNNFKGANPNLLLYGSTNFAGSSITAEDGKYQITVPRTNMTYYLNAMCGGYQFTNLTGGTVTVASASISNVNFIRTLTTNTIGGSILVAGRSYNPALDGELWITQGAQSVKATNSWWEMKVPSGSLVTLTATSTNPACTISSDFPKPYRVTSDVSTLAFFLDIPGSMVQTGFTSTGTNHDDSAGTVSIPVTLSLPNGMTNWPVHQSFIYWVDESSTAEYGVDYKMSGDIFTFYNTESPTPFIIPLTLIHDARPKYKTIVIKIGAANSASSLGPITTFTYTIRNAPYTTALAGLSISNGQISFAITNLTDYATNHVLRCNDLVSQNWETSHVFTGVSGQLNWSEPLSNGWDRVFYRTISE